MFEAIIGSQGQQMKDIGMDNDEQNDVPIFIDQKTSDLEFLSYFGFAIVFILIVYFGKFLPQSHNTASYKHKIYNYNYDSYWFDQNHIFDAERMEHEIHDFMDHDMMVEKMEHFMDFNGKDTQMYHDYLMNSSLNNTFEKFSQALNGIRPLYRTLQIELEIPNLIKNQTFWFNLTTNIKTKAWDGKSRSFRVDFKKKVKIPSFLPNNASNTNVSFFLMKDFCIDYSYIDAEIEFATTVFANAVIIKMIHGNPAYNSLIVWLNINLPVILAVIILVRMCKSTPIVKEQMYCTILSLATLMYDKPLSLWTLFSPGENTISLNKFFARIYPGFLFFFIVHIFAQCFNYTVKWFVEIIVVAFFSATVFNAFIDMRHTFPLTIPDKNGNIINYTQFNTQVLHIAGLVFLVIYVIALRSTGVEEHETRFNIYITIFMVFGGLYSAYIVLMTNESFRITPYAQLIPFALVNTFAFIMEYLHADYSPSIEQIYQKPGESTAYDQLGIAENKQREENEA